MASGVGETVGAGVGVGARGVDVGATVAMAVAVAVAGSDDFATGSVVVLAHAISQAMADRAIRMAGNFVPEDLVKVSRYPVDECLNSPIRVPHAMGPDLHLVTNSED